MKSGEAESLWLVRRNIEPSTSSGPELPGLNQIECVGPVQRSQVLAMIEQGLLDAEDEVCPENGYWFQLKEKDEVERFLGIRNLLLRKIDDGEATLPGIGSDGEPTEPEITAAELAVEASGADGSSTSMIKVPKRENKSAQPTIIVSKPTTAQEIRERFPRVAPLSEVMRSNPSAELGWEKGRLIFLLIVLGAVAACVGLIWALGMLRT